MLSEIRPAMIWMYCHEKYILSQNNEILSQTCHNCVLLNVGCYGGCSLRLEVTEMVWWSIWVTKPQKNCHKTERLCHKSCDKKVLSQGGDSAMLRGCAVAGRWSAPSESRPVPVAPSSELPARDHRSPPSPTHFGTRPTCSILIIRLNQTCQKTGTLAIQTLTH